MRAIDLLSGLTPLARRRLADRLGLACAGVEALVARMRSPEVVAPVLAHTSSGLLREDLLLLTANPFAVVAPDEVADPELFQDLGLLAREAPGVYRVNLDLALTLLPALPLEFGYALTLLARLEPSRTWALARAVGIGPRPSRVELLLALAEALVAREGVMGRLVRLTLEERRALEAALDAGELPDDVAPGLPLGLPPAVVPAAGATGAVGLLFEVVQPARGGVRHVAVPLELHGVLRQWLGEVPLRSGPQSPPGGASGGGRSRRRSPPTEPVLPSLDMDLSVRGVHETADFVGLPAASDPRGQGTPMPMAVVRTVRVEPAGALVDLETAAAVERVVGHPDLCGDIVGVYGERWVALREGTEPSAWCRRAALILEWIER